MGYMLKYINIFDDINSSNVDDITDFYIKADLRIEGRFKTPSFKDLDEINKSIEDIGELTTDAIRKHLETFSCLTSKVAERIASELLNELELLVPTVNALKSNYGQIAYWIKETFSDVLTEEVNNIYINRTCNKYEIYMIYLLSKLNNNIVLIDYEYKAGKYKLYNNLNVHESNTSERLGVSIKIDISNDQLEEMLLGKVKSISNTGYKILLLGEDASKKIESTLVKIGENTPENVMLLRFGIGKVTFEETERVHRPDVESMQALKKLIGNHMFMKHSKYAEQATKFIKREITNEMIIVRAITKLVTFICLYNKYKLTEEILVCYGKIDKQAEVYLNFLEFIGKTVIVIDTLGDSEKVIDKTWIKIELGERSKYHPYPETLVSNSIAFEASREITNTLYTGNNLGLYRDRQYKTCNIVVLNTTFDELLLLWGQENKMKPYFESTDESVTVPVFYTKISGAGEDYLRKLSKLATEHSIICYRPLEIMNDMAKSMVILHSVGVNNTSFREQNPMFSGGKLKIDAIMQYKTFTYKHLDIALQRHILSKLAILIEKKLVSHVGVSDANFIDLALNIGLNLSKRIQQEMQWYDYTKQSPKLVVICQDEEIITIEESIVITLLHLCGWDIAIVVPTCYNISGDSLNTSEMFEHIIGEPRFDLNISKLEMDNSNIVGKRGERGGRQGGFLSRIFK